MIPEGWDPFLNLSKSEYREFHPSAISCYLFVFINDCQIYFECDTSRYENKAYLQLIVNVILEL